ncbi:hypothetical protein [Vaginisenegalia massiliensis]|uniref:hypothetical protein n=1 Tax=Vaginisenegalia massiliensis TaxID=2058294 RepID=UPI000F53F4D2|nr:hypothetical protein [Vaginisenegalia massiliensis]
MENKQVLISLLLSASLGIICILAGVLIRKITDKKNRSCSKQAIGHVVKYDFPGDVKMYPVVEFEAEGQTFLTKKKFNSVKSLSIGFPLSIESKAYEDAKGNLCVKTGPIANLRNLSEKLWPLGKEMIVYYNPQNPTINYVERPLTNKFLTAAFNIAGMSIIFLTVVLYFIISNSN